MRDTFGRAAPELLDTQYAREIWKLFQSSALKPDSVLTGLFVDESGSADVAAVLDQIEEARREQEIRERGRAEAAARE